VGQTVFLAETILLFSFVARRIETASGFVAPSGADPKFATSSPMAQRSVMHVNVPVGLAKWKKYSYMLTRTWHADVRLEKQI